LNVLHPIEVSTEMALALGLNQASGAHFQMICSVEMEAKPAFSGVLHAARICAMLTHCEARDDGGAERGGVLGAKAISMRRTQNKVPSFLFWRSSPD
jgi:hypothetical protein